MKTTLALLVVAVLTIGCGTKTSSSSVANSTDYDLVGTWVGKQDISDEDLEKMREKMRETQTEEEIDALMEWALSVEETLEIFEDGTFSSTDSVMGIPIKDTWKAEGDTLTLASSGSSSSVSGKASEGMPELNDDDFKPNKVPMDLSIEAGGTELVRTGELGDITIRVVYKKK